MHNQKDPVPKKQIQCWGMRKRYQDAVNRTWKKESKWWVELWMGERGLVSKITQSGT